MERIRFYFACMKWLWKNRETSNNRAKYRRMMREVKI